MVPQLTLCISMIEIKLKGRYIILKKIKGEGGNMKNILVFDLHEKCQAW